jgi:hypothetical protein
VSLGGEFVSLGEVVESSHVGRVGPQCTKRKLCPASPVPATSTPLDVVCLVEGVDEVIGVFQVGLLEVCLGGLHCGRWQQILGVVCIAFVCPFWYLGAS